MSCNQHLNRIITILAALAVLNLTVPFASAEQTAAGSRLTGMAAETITTTGIEASIPEYTRAATITIEGRTMPLAEMQIFVNNARVRVTKAGPDGVFRISGISLPQEKNTITIEAREGSNTARKEYNIILDNSPPVAKLDRPLPETSTENSITVSGSANEETTVYYRIIHRTETAQPRAVPGVRATKTEETAAEIAWDPSPETDLKEYSVKRSNIRIATTTLTSFRDEGLSPGTTYVYTVSAVDASCNEGDAAPLQIKTKPSNKTAAIKKPVAQNLSCEPAYKTTKTPFTTTIELAEGINDIEIIFEDKAGNRQAMEKRILKDTTEPRFLQTNLRELSPSYSPEIKIRGQLSEQGTIFFHLNDEKKPEAFEITNPDGTFSQSINLKTTKRLKTAPGKVTAEAGEGWVNSIKLEAVDLAGNRQTEGPVDINYLLCGQGTWWQANIGEPLPQMLLPRLMIQGVQQIGIPFNITYTGSHIPKISRVTVRPIQLAPSAKQDYDHDWVTVQQYTRAKGPKNLVGYAQIMFNNVEPLPEKTDAGANEKETALSEHRKGDCLVPGVGCVKLFLQMEIQFQETYSITPTDPSIPMATTKIENRVQRICIPVEIGIDKTIPTSVIPKGLLRNLVSGIDKALELVDKALQPIETTGQYLLYGCLASTVWNWYNIAMEKWACEFSSDISAIGDKWDKEIAEAGLCDKIYTDDSDGTKRSACKACEKAIKERKETETTVVNALCDRIGCPNAPTLQKYIATNEGKAKEIPDATSKVNGNNELEKWLFEGKIYSGNDCAFIAKKPDQLGIMPLYNDVGRGMTLRELFDIAKGEDTSYVPNANDCKEILRPAHPNCCGIAYQREWSSACGTGPLLGDELDLFDELKESTCLAAEKENINAPDLECNRVWNSVAGFCEKKTGSPIPEVIPTGATWIAKPGAARTDDLFVFVIPGDKESSYKVYRGRLLQTYEFKELDKKEQEKLTSNGKLMFEIGALTPAFDTNADLTKFFFPRKEKQDIAGFGQALFKDTNTINARTAQSIYNDISTIISTPEQAYIVQPNSGFLRSLQCVCIPAITSYLHMWKSLLTMLHGCFNRILLTGEGSEGFCAAALSNTVCDLLYEFISCITSHFGSGPGTGARAETTGFGNILSTITSAGTEVSRSVNKRYGETSLYKSLFSERKLVHAMCLWAFTGTWDLDISTMFQQQVAEIPVETMGALTTCHRTFISYDPTTQPSGLTTWAYRISGGLIAGADLNYRLKLKCSPGFGCSQSDYPNGKCDCQTGEQTISIASPELGSGIARKFQTINFDSPFVVNPQQDPTGASYRYDTAILEWDWTDPQTKQQRTKQATCSIGETDGGNAPLFCGLDVFSGKFRCIFGEAESGIRILNAKPEYPEGQTAFLLDQQLKFSIDIKQTLPPERARQQSAKKFLTYEILDGAGQTVYGTINSAQQMLKTTTEATSQPYELATDGTYKITIPKDGNTSLLGSFKLDEATLKKASAGFAEQFSQEVWSPGASIQRPDFVTRINLADSGGNRYAKERFFLIILDLKQQGQEKYEIKLIDPHQQNNIKQKQNNGWLDYATTVIKSTTNQGAGGTETEQISIEEPATRGSTTKYTGSIEFKRISKTDYPRLDEMQILVRYIPPQQQADPCTKDPKPLTWMAEFTIYDADQFGYANPDQISTDPETGKQQKERIQFNVQCSQQPPSGDGQTPAPQTPPEQKEAGQPTPPAEQTQTPPAQPTPPADKKAPELKIPENGFSENLPAEMHALPIKFAWEPVENADYYTIHIDYPGPHEPKEFEVKDTYKTVTISPIGIHKWKVKAHYGGGTVGPWSEERTFTVTKK